MARRYVQVYYDLINSLTLLSEAERGRLLTAMLEYAGRGEEPDLRGNERFIWPQIKGQIDRDNARYEDISQSRSDAGKLGGRPKANAIPEKQKKLKLSPKSNCLQDKDKDDNNNEDDFKKKVYYNAAWRTSARARSAVAQNLIDGWEAIRDNAAGLEGIDVNRILCEFMEAGMLPEQISEVMQNCTLPGFLDSHLFTEAVHLGVVDEDSPLRPAGYDV